MNGTIISDIAMLNALVSNVSMLLDMSLNIVLMRTVISSAFMKGTCCDSDALNFFSIGTKCCWSNRLEISITCATTIG